MSIGDVPVMSRQQRIRASLIEQAGRLQFPPQAAHTHLEKMRTFLTSWAYQPNRYEHTGSVLSRQYLGQLTLAESLQFNSEDVLQGFRVMARILQYAPPAYKDYCADTQSPLEMESLARILLASGRTPDFFASMRNRLSGEYEAAFGIAVGGPACPEEPFIITVVEGSSQPQFVPNSALLSSVALPAPIRNPEAMCPARGQFMERVWHQMVATCVTNPDLFARDLGIPALSLDVLEAQMPQLS